MRRASPFLFAALLAACGDAPSPAPSASSRESPPERWSVAGVEGMPGATDVAVFGGDLVLTVARERSLFFVSRKALTDGGKAAARAVPLEISPEARIAGGDEFAAKGFQAKDLWDLPVDLQALAITPEGSVFVGERSYRVVYWGVLQRRADGSVEKARLDRIFTYAGATRPGKERSDWRDTGGGLAGLVSVPTPGSPAPDLVAVDRHGPDESRTRFWKLDRFGFVQGWFEAEFGKGVAADVGGVTWKGDRPLVVRGPGRGVLHHVRAGKNLEKVEVAPGVEGPDVPGAGAWLGVTLAPDGVLYLAGGGDSCRVAWRAEASTR